MKKAALLLLSLTIGFTTTAQSKHSSFIQGRSIYLSVGPETSFPIFNKSTLQSGCYGWSAEAGFWGITKPTGYSIVVDFLKQDAITASGDIASINTFKSTWIGIKGYLTLWQNSNTCYMVYAAPKILVSKWEGRSNALFEIGINPCFNINKHILVSLSLCDQIMDVDNNFCKSIWNLGGSAGIVILR
jgi:hypothetical protein